MLRTVMRPSTNFMSMPTKRSSATPPSQFRPHPWHGLEQRVVPVVLFQQPHQLRAQHIVAAAHLGDEPSPSLCRQIHRRVEKGFERLPAIG
jgi:hypothetical protein